ncbi:transcriptional regulator domain-containing protein [Parvibaculum lavamentivorans]|uniref:transcriptional regulator domain-containing protein n=1 Tax=Parvibaculum lavamentivorans TaxID=256618 RepID=UPI003CCB028F
MNWQYPEQYEWLATLSAHGFAWEFLRRNTAFRKAADLSNSLPKITTDTSARFMSHNADSDGAKSWGLLQFESPRIDARGANVFWNPESCPSVLPVVTCSDAGRASGH